MLVLIAVGFAAGLITALSPCVLPVLPILLAGGATGGRRKPYAIVAGLIASFTAFTLAGVWLLDALGLPKDLLRNLALALLFLVAASLLFPRLGDWLERPLLRLSRRPAGDFGGGLLLGAALGLVFVPCAGPVLAAVTVVAASRELGLDVVVLTLAYAAGAALPMLLVAAGGRWASGMRAVRAHALGVRRALGVVVGATALAIALGADNRFQTAVPGYTESLQERIERSSAAERRLDDLTGRERGAAGESEGLRDFGEAPGFTGISAWLNTPGGRALSMEGLRGKVVLVDFWTYSCVNCLRTLPFLRGWDRAYRDEGLQIVGVHTPEFAFEHEEDNVRGAVARLDVDYAVALDNDYGTWNAYGNRYWPAKYLIDRAGHVRFVHFGEGAYEETEQVIRSLLAERPLAQPVSAGIDEATPSREATRETYLGYDRIAGHANPVIAPDRDAPYRLPAELEPDQLAYGGRWRVEAERAVAGREARLRMRFRAREVNLVLGGMGRVEVLLDGRRVRTIAVRGSRLYQLLDLPAFQTGLLELRVARGVAGYAFTFG
jgi:cytochrome c biogenesis protein CcdA/thiol-disulfide isomerase/thioredoxin